MPAFAYTTIYCDGVYQPSDFTDNLYVDGHTEDYRQWGHTGYSPYLNAISDGNYIGTPTPYGTKYEGWFTYANCNPDAPAYVHCALGFYAKTIDPDIGDGFDIYDKDWNFVGSVVPTSTSYQWYWVYPAVYSKVTVNNFKAILAYTQWIKMGEKGEGIEASGSNILVDASKLVVWYADPTDVIQMDGWGMMHRVNWDGNTNEWTRVWTAMLVCKYQNYQPYCFAEVGITIEIDYPEQRIHNVGVFFTWMENYYAEKDTHRLARR